MKNKLAMLAVIIAIVGVCAMSALAISTVTLSAPANYTTNGTKSNYTFTWTVADVDEFGNDAQCNLSLRDSAGTSHTWGPINASDGVALSYDANFSAGSEGRFTWTANCTNSSGPYVDGGVRNFVWDKTGPLFANITQTTNVPATSGTTGNYTVTVDVYDAWNAVGTPVRLWYGYSGTADTARTMTRVGTTNRYTTTVLVGIGQTVIYDVTATDSLSNAATSSSTTFGAASSTSCDTTKTIIYAAFGLIALLAIVGGAYVLINMGMSEGSVESMGAMLVGLIVLGVSILVGFYVIGNLASITCLA